MTGRPAQRSWYSTALLHHTDCICAVSFLDISFKTFPFKILNYCTHCAVATYFKMILNLNRSDLATVATPDL